MTDTAIQMQYYQFILVLFVCAVLAIVSKIAWSVIDNVVRKKINEKPLINGTHEACGNCLAMQAAVVAIPEIKKNQAELRKTDLPQMNRELAAITILTKSLDERVDKLFKLIEQDWMREIAELRQALRDKNVEIDRLVKLSAEGT